MTTADSLTPRLANPLVQRLRPYTTTIFAEMSALAVATGSINLGQGFPDTDGPPSLLAAAQHAIAHGVNQYPPGPPSCGKPSRTPGCGITVSGSIPTPRC